MCSTVPTSSAFHQTNYVIVFTRPHQMQNFRMIPEDRNLGVTQISICVKFTSKPGQASLEPVFVSATDVRLEIHQRLVCGARLRPLLIVPSGAAANLPVVANRHDTFQNATATFVTLHPIRLEVGQLGENFISVRWRRGASTRHQTPRVTHEGGTPERSKSYLMTCLPSN